MVKLKDPGLDELFAALSDPTRRAVLDQLSSGSFSVTALAQHYGMSLPGFMKHLRVLEQAGLIERSKEGRVVRCVLRADPMEQAASWLARYEQFWNQRLDALGRYLYHQEDITSWTTPVATSDPRSASPGPTPRRPKKSGAPGPTRKR